MFKLGLLLCFVSALVQLSDNQTTDPNSTETTPNISVASTTTTSTTTTTTVTTTTIAPSIPGTTIPPNTDISKCPCDLTGNACDVNCCCDPECSAADKLVFSECLSSSYTLDDKLCFNKDVFLFENGPAASGDSNGLFCIYFDNDAERNYYTNPTLVTSQTEFLRYADQYRRFSFQDTVPPTLTSQFNNYYRSGDPIYVVFPNNAFSYLGLPTSQASSTLCTDSNPAGYLLDQTNQCSRSLARAECETSLALKASTFYKDFRIVKDPFLLKAFNSSTSIKDPIVGSPNLTDVTDLYNNNFTLALELEPTNASQCIQNGFKGPCNFTEPPVGPLLIGSVCSRVLVEVHYRFETNGIYGVEKAYVSFVFSDITSTSVTQTFSTSFSKFQMSSTSSQPVARSGNPGYQIGQPIIAGVLNRTVVGATTDERILLTQARGQQLTLVRPSVSGDCLTDAGQLREPVLFGQDMRTGCFIQFNSTSDMSICQLLQQSIFTAIEGYAVPTFDPAFNVYPKNNRYVAMFGNSEVKKTGDWVEILYQNRPVPQTAASSQCFLSLGANLQILYANIGALPNPQPKIVGVAFVYDAPQTVSYKCSSMYCQPGSSSLAQKIEISSSVTFIDVSQSPQAMEGKYPTFAVRLPYDFFYPFLNSAPTWRSPSTAAWVVVVLISRHFLSH